MPNIGPQDGTLLMRNMLEQQHGQAHDESKMKATALADNRATEMLAAPWGKDVRRHMKLDPPAKVRMILVASSFPAASGCQRASKACHCCCPMLPAPSGLRLLAAPAFPYHLRSYLAQGS